MGLVVNVQPLAARRSHFRDEDFDEAFPHPQPLVISVNDGVEEEGVRPAVPARVHEADQAIPLERAHPRQAVPL